MRDGRELGGKRCDGQVEGDLMGLSLEGALDMVE